MPVNASGLSQNITGVTATAGNEYDADRGAIKVVNNSGMSGSGSLTDTHDNDYSALTMWHTNNNPGAGAWIKFDLGEDYSLDEMYIWNMNQANNTARGLKNVKIEYSLTGEDGNWTELQPETGMVFPDSVAGYPFQFAKASGLAGMPATNLNDGSSSPVSFDGAEARYVKITAHPDAGVGSWGDVYFGLSEVRFTAAVNKLVTDVIISSENEATEIAEEGGTLQFSAQVVPDDASVQGVNWSVTDSEGNPTYVASISSNGLLKANTNGTVVVVATAKDGSGVKDEFTVTISGQTKVVAIAGNEYDADHGAKNVVNNSGMSGSGSVSDTHDNDRDAFTMWHTNNNPGTGAWIQFDLGAQVALDKMYIWNMNQANNTTRGLKNVKIEYSLTGAAGSWTELQPETGMAFTDGAAGYPFQFARASGQEGLSATNLNDGGNSPVSFDGAEARYVKITAHPDAGVGSWGDVYFGLSEVRFTEVSESDPAVEAVITAIADLPATAELTLSDKDAVAAAREAYDALSPAQQDLVTNYAVLQAAEAKIAELETPDTVTIIVKVRPGGRATGSGDYAAGSSVTLTATPNYGYRFSNWTVDGTSVSEDASYTFTAEEALTVQANFSPAIFGVTAAVNPAGGGSVSQEAGTAAYNQSYTVTASASEGYVFVSWTDADGRILSRDAAYTFRVLGDVSLTANFQSVAPETTVHTVVFLNSIGDVLSVQYVEDGHAASEPARPSKPDCSFESWDAGFGDVRGDLVIRPVYSAKAAKYTVTAVNGTVQNGSLFEFDTQATVIADAAAEGKKFECWKVNNIPVSYDASYSFYVTGNVTLTASYVDEATVIEKTPAARIDEAVLVNEATGRISFVSQLINLDENFGNLVEFGFLFKKSDTAPAAGELELGAAGVVQAKCSKITKTGQSLYNKKALSGETWYARIYMVYADESGNLITVYSDNIISGTMPE